MAIALDPVKQCSIRTGTHGNNTDTSLHLSLHCRMAGLGISCPVSMSEFELYTKRVEAALQSSLDTS